MLPTIYPDAEIASIQTWFTNSADAGGIPLEGNAITGPVMCRERAFYHESAPANGAQISSSGVDTATSACATGWLSASCEGDTFASCAAWGNEHYGFVGVRGFLCAPSACAGVARATAVRFSVGFIARIGPRMCYRYEQPSIFHADDPNNQMVLDFVVKMVRNSYKIVADDAQRFRDAGFDDESYIDVFNTVAIQTSLDRLANSIGVSADDRPLLSGAK